MELTEVNQLVNRQTQPLSNHYTVSELKKNVKSPINHLGSLRQKKTKTQLLKSHHEDIEN